MGLKSKNPVDRADVAGPGEEPVGPAFLDSRTWVNRFIFWLFVAFALLASVSWAYNLWCHFRVVVPAHEILEAGDSDSLTAAVELMETPHPFAGYETWHGFGDDRSRNTNGQVEKVLSGGRDYSEEQVRRLTHAIAYYVPAFLEIRKGRGVPVVPGDSVVIASLHSRWANAVHSGFVLSGHLSVVAALLGILFFVYVKLRLWGRIGPRKPTARTP